jgi:hypothetical protein
LNVRIGLMGHWEAAWASCFIEELGATHQSTPDEQAAIESRERHNLGLRLPRWRMTPLDRSDLSMVQRPTCAQ